MTKLIGPFKFHGKVYYEKDGTKYFGACLDIIPKFKILEDSYTVIKRIEKIVRKDRNWFEEFIKGYWHPNIDPHKVRLYKSLEDIK